MHPHLEFTGFFVCFQSSAFIGFLVMNSLLYSMSNFLVLVEISIQTTSNHSLILTVPFPTIPLSFANADFDAANLM